MQPEPVVDQLQVERQRDHEPARRRRRSETALDNRVQERVRRQHEDDPVGTVLTVNDAVGPAGHHPGCRSTTGSIDGVVLVRDPASARCWRRERQPTGVSVGSGETVGEHALGSIRGTVASTPTPAWMRAVSSDVGWPGVCGGVQILVEVRDSGGSHFRFWFTSRRYGDIPGGHHPPGPRIKHRPRPGIDPV